MTSPLSEALETVHHNEAWPMQLNTRIALGEVIDAARLLLAGQPIQWCETHFDLAAPDRNICWTWDRRAVLGDLWMKALDNCLIVSKLLCDPPTDQS
jgi:hypothetical protein